MIGVNTAAIDGSYYMNKKEKEDKNKITMPIEQQTHS